ncbi:LOB domain-containing protein 36-like [Cucurbita maxima]|uniref:LOB domain-containing protein 36-like n=1 Tax=Cucurbita maxima TaxID=3661 RepID=A0A6J1I2T4_CUCMA|nr:LOB domain-containing protein 36-like [Cucurbita maxima]XP_022971743.1 LOB domain-containing protein 36-like [Cucurbita maxima]
MSSSNSPCAACKFLRRKCTQECVFAPYFPPDQPQKFANVHKVFGASNVAKLLNELNASQREDAVNSLAYEAEFRLRDPVYGCVGLISVLQHKLKQMQSDLYNAKKELASYVGPQAMIPILQPSTAIMTSNPQGPVTSPSSSVLLPYNMSPMFGIPSSGGGGSSQQMLIRESPHQQQQHHHQIQQQQQLFEAQQLAAAVAAREQQEMFRAYEQKQTQQHQQQQHSPSQRQHELLRFNGFDPAGVGAGAGTGAGGFNNQMNSPSDLTLGTFPDNSYQIQTQPEHSHSHSHSHSHHHHPLQVQLFPQPQQTQLDQSQQQQQQPHPHRSQQIHKPEATADDGRNINIGPSC